MSWIVGKNFLLSFRFSYPLVSVLVYFVVSNILEKTFSSPAFSQTFKSGPSCLSIYGNLFMQLHTKYIKDPLEGGDEIADDEDLAFH